MKLLIVSALSGAGKSTALDTLEDCGYYCIDIYPSPYSKTSLVMSCWRMKKPMKKTAIGIDARNKKRQSE